MNKVVMSVQGYHVANIVCTFRSVAPVNRMAGYDWYKVTSDTLIQEGSEFGFNKYQSCGIFATVSPQKSIDRNWSIYRAIIRGKHSNEITRAQYEKVNGILNTGMRAMATNADIATIASYIRGPKVNQFYANLLGDYTNPTIDRHAVSNVMGYPIGKVATPKQLAYASEVIKISAQLIGINAAALQAIVWQAWRGQFGSLGDSDIHFVANWKVREVSYYPKALFD